MPEFIRGNKKKSTISIVSCNKTLSKVLSEWLLGFLVNKLESRIYIYIYIFLFLFLLSIGVSYWRSPGKLLRLIGLAGAVKQLHEPANQNLSYGTRWV